jgi:hypothetical protein
MRHRLAGAFSASLVLIVALLVAIVVTVLTWLIPVARTARRVTGYLARAPLGVRLALTLVLYMLSERLLRSHGAYSIAALVLVNNGEGLLLNNFLNKSAPQDWRMFLFKNNITPAETDTIATYTKSTFTGYADKNLAASAWTVVEGAPSSASAAVQTWTSTADQTAESAYGYGFQQQTSNVLGWAERFNGAPFTIQNLNDNIQVTPQITAD